MNYMIKTRRTTRTEKIANPGIYQIPVAYEMSPDIKELAKKAGFVCWGKEPWGPGKGNIDWSSNYDKELMKFADLLRKEYAKKD